VSPFDDTPLHLSPGTNDTIHLTPDDFEPNIVIDNKISPESAFEEPVNNKSDVVL